MADHRPTASLAANGTTTSLAVNGTSSGEPTTFAELGVDDRVVVALARQGITEAFPIQVATIRDAIDGRDVLGRGRTGSGKTLAFVLPLLTRLAATGRGATNGQSRDNGDGNGHGKNKRQPSDQRRRRTRALILAPTRELANQIRDVLDPLARSLDLRHATIYGGVGYGGQISALRSGVDIIVACPGRLVDLLDSQHADLRSVETTVIDEADHMADLGFLKDVREILDSTPDGAQRLLFSATLDRGVDAIVRDYLSEPVVHEVDEEEIPSVDMDHHVLHVEQPDKLAVIADLCAAPGRSLVFTRTKHGATRLTQQLIKAGVPSVELHGNLSQSARARNLASFAAGRADTLVATDVAARGIHVDDVALVIHADPPDDHKTFLHRSGRTARAGASGTVVTLMTQQQRRAVRRLVSDAGVDVTTTKVDPGHPLLAQLAPGDREFREMTTAEPESSNRRPQSRGSGPRQGRSSRPPGRGPRRNDRGNDGSGRSDDRQSAGRGGDHRRSEGRGRDDSRNESRRDDSRRDDRRDGGRRDDRRGAASARRSGTDRRARHR